MFLTIGVQVLLVQVSDKAFKVKALDWDQWLICLVCHRRKSVRQSHMLQALGLASFIARPIMMLVCPASLIPDVRARFVAVDPMTLATVDAHWPHEAKH
jgi:type II secretory pathway component PulL